MNTVSILFQYQFKQIYDPDNPQNKEEGSAPPASSAQMSIMQSEIKQVTIVSECPFSLDYTFIGKNSFLETVYKNRQRLQEIREQLKQHSIEAESLQEY